jgi:dTMP kinase
MSVVAQIAKRGAFILLEGCDRSGKSTQCARLVERLVQAGVPVRALRFPERTTEIGKMINSYLTCTAELDDRAVHLLFSANRWEQRGHIMQLLEQGTTIVCDRYTFSGVAFSASKPGMDIEWCKAPDAGACMRAHAAG